MLGKISTLILLMIGFTTSAQEEKKEHKAVETKMDAFVSKAGTITKFQDFNLKPIKLLYGDMVETRIRKINSGQLKGYFFQIEKAGKYSSSTASVEYADLVEIIKAFGSLKADVESDLALNPDYLENKFITVDGFQVGYLLQKGKVIWYLKLEKYGSDSTAFIADANDLEIAFNDAKTKIEELKE